MHTFLHISLYRQLMAVIFSSIFFVLSAVLAGITIQAMVEGAFGSMQLIEAFIKAINMAVISLATFELGLVVIKEYGGKEDEGHIGRVADGHQIQPTGTGRKSLLPSRHNQQCSVSLDRPWSLPASLGVKRLP